MDKPPLAPRGADRRTGDRRVAAADRAGPERRIAPRRAAGDRRTGG